MGVFRRIEDLLKKTDDKTVSWSDAEKALRWKQLQEDLGKFKYEPDGFSYEFKSGVQKISWSDILRIEAYKHDLVTNDAICLDIFWLDNKWTITEETPGWYQFLDRLQKAFQSTPPWHDIIAQSSYAPNHTVLYQRIDSA